MIAAGLLAIVVIPRHFLVPNSFIPAYSPPLSHRKPYSVPTLFQLYIGLGYSWDIYGTKLGQSWDIGQGGQARAKGVLR